MIGVQWFVPARMIYQKENTLRTGTAYKFRTAPVDPSDPFRGKYIVLSFENTVATVANTEDWHYGETVYVSFVRDTAGFAQIGEIRKTPPPERSDYLATEVSYVFSDSLPKIGIDFPFDTYYMEESKALPAELLYRDSQRDSTSITYALVRLKNGDAVLEDVLIDGEPIRDRVMNRPARDF